MIKWLYDIFGGRKLFYFNYIFITNVFILLFTRRWTESFGWFSVGAFGVIVLGIEGNKYIKGKTER
jgi:hypothetical protein